MSLGKHGVALTRSGGAFLFPLNLAVPSDTLTLFKLLDVLLTYPTPSCYLLARDQQTAQSLVASCFHLVSLHRSIDRIRALRSGRPEGEPDHHRGRKRLGLKDDI